MKLQTSSSQEYLSSRPFETKQSKNIFTINDSRYKHIKNLEKKNKQLTNKLVDLQTDLAQIDEFKIAISLDRPPMKNSRALFFSTNDVKKGKLQIEPQEINDDFHQRRIEIMKAQLLKQQRYIKRLTTILQTTRKFYEDLREYMQYFSSVLRQSAQGNDYYIVEQKETITSQQVIQSPTNKEVANQNEELKQQKNQIQKKVQFTLDDSFDRQQAQSKIQRITKDKEFIEVAEKQQQYISLKNLLQQFKSNEDRENFISTFTLAYQKIIDFERGNQDYRNLLEVQQQGKNRKVFYKHPMRSLIQRYGQFFPVKSIYTAFPMKDRERLDHFLISLEGMSSQIQRDLQKVDAFWLFKSNPFFFKSNDYRQSIELPVQILEEPQLFDEFLAEPEKHRVINLDQTMLSNLEKDLLQLMDSLMEMQKKFQSECNDLQFLQKPQITRISDQLRKSLESLVCLSSMIGNNNLQTINKMYVIGQKDAYLYQHQIFSQNDFDSKYQMLELLLSDLCSLVQVNEMIIVKKALMMLKSIKNIYEIQKMITTIRESEITLLKQKLDLLLQDYSGVNAFITSAEQQVKGFFNAIGNKFAQVNNVCNVFLESEKIVDSQFRKQFGQNLKKQLKDITDYIAGLTSIERNDNCINIKQLQQEFDKKVSTFYVKSEQLQRMNEQISKRLQLA
ncbi:unnamed protein product (macronuclear) [Paramecium tetraurelia]|uniref:Uncharacterized protein n=1 Tax=Paramecium tetraurelia TaxID=5888 RepID=A0CBG6_PARTE|nr:uncharacterized protein GSPATT00036916001 [Paramecium tetraurelia]CAK68133.1 unnamed protein product [Paramecium tetraurelia]|eukprot:XP_001435530.1 hypothetical protein (macronuclear) [Paramecium tetraurelia strain d4-2]